MLEAYAGRVLPQTTLNDPAGLHAQVFSAPPWNEDAVATQTFRQRLLTDAARDGFRVVVVRTRTRVDGFATGWLTRTPLPGERVYP